MEFVAAHRDEHGVEPICAVLEETTAKIAPSTFYARTSPTRQPSARTLRDSALVEDIKVAHQANLGVYGARKIHAELNREGVKVARCTVERLMRAEGLRGIPREKTRKTTIGDGAETERPEDLVKRQFIATAPNQLWVADLTYVRTHAGWTYVAFVLDVFSRMIVGWQVSTSLRTDLALDALDMGLWTRQRAGQDVTGSGKRPAVHPAGSGRTALRRVTSPRLPPLVRAGPGPSQKRDDHLPAPDVHHSVITRAKITASGYMDPSSTLTILVSQEEAAHLLCVERTTIWRMCCRGDLERVRIGRRSLVTRASIEGFVASQVQCRRNGRGSRPRGVVGEVAVGVGGDGDGGMAEVATDHVQRDAVQ